MRHSLDPFCPCDACERDRFEARATLAVVLLLTAAGGLLLLLVGVQ